MWFEAFDCLYRNFVEKNSFGYYLGSPVNRMHHAYGSFKEVGIDFLGFDLFTCFFRSVMNLSYNIVIIQYRLIERGVFGLGRCWFVNRLNGIELCRCFLLLRGYCLISSLGGNNGCTLFL